MTRISHDSVPGWLVFIVLAIVATAIYALGIHGGFLFDDYPNIVDNHGVQPADATVRSLIRSALSSPSSEFKRPLASLTFAANFLASGLDPVAMKITNVAIHLANGVLAFLLCRMILKVIGDETADDRNSGITAAIVAGCWLLLPINLTAVLYVVQRMESLANLFVLIGLLGYVRSRIRMQHSASATGFWAAATSIVFPTILGLLAKETAVMLPLYALVIEFIVFRGLSLRPSSTGDAVVRDKRIIGAYVLVLALPIAAGLAWILPGLLRPSGWSTRNFTLGTRLLTEARVVIDYVAWTIVPTPGALSFYHDDFAISSGFFAPWTTAASILALGATVVLAFATHRKAPTVSLGLLLYLACHLLTATILPLELVYEHRNYFASLGLMLAVVPLLAPWSGYGKSAGILVRRTLLAALVVQFAAQLAILSHAWNSPLDLAQALAERAPKSPRAQYELGRTYIVLSHYDEQSPFTPLAYAPLERGAALKGSTILPEQALIFLNSRLGRPLKDAWWDSITSKLRENKVGVQDESALGALSDCMRQGLCHLPVGRMMDAYLAALSHESKSARLLAMYSDFAWNQLNDHELSVRVAREVVEVDGREPAYRISLINKLINLSRFDEARTQRDTLVTMNVGGAYDDDIARIDTALAKP
ncbi:MAG TPA: hypothetical protein VM621_10090 [Luteibacter sp.]|uniref:hypothetical protein n=1 Tax=Luteibacter sp. TaxID=1886636 RepID=UPI002C433C6B|nr:hypothetical protein [Luteibacter sp.]HVI55390.1 hypothetical protein [Luteibacter sp.]